MQIVAPPREPWPNPKLYGELCELSVEPGQRRPYDAGMDTETLRAVQANAPELQPIIDAILASLRERDDLVPEQNSGLTTVSMRMNDGSMKMIGAVTSKALPGPDFSHALTPQQVNQAYNAWLERALDIDPAVRHSP